jgi:sn1-specific diacylglycerol lipase
LDKVGQTCGFEGDGHCCHKGVLARSKWLYNDIHKTKVLKRLYSDDSPFKDYGLVVCGHSLGAGCASVLAIMLQPAFPSVRCYAYCPPGGLLDEEMSAKCEDFIISVVRHDDIIPRLSFHSFGKLLCMTKLATR